MDAERWHAVLRGSNTAHNPTVSTVNTADDSFDETVDTFDTAVYPVDSPDEPLDKTLDPSVDRIVKAINPSLLRITQS